jgi:dipeptidyl aminopeptidase/acylaminoacyl peptidase
VENSAGAWYSPTGHLLYTDRAGGLYAAGFDPERLQLTTPAVPLLENVVPTTLVLSTTGTALYSVAVGARRPSELLWVSRDGRTSPLDSTWRGEFDYPAISPDGRALAVSVRDGPTQLWIWRADGTRQKLTQDGSVNWRPSWSLDGQSIVFASNKRGGGSQDAFDVYRMPVDGSAPPALLVDHTFGLWEAELSRDGQWLIVRADEAEGGATIRARRLTGDSTLLPLVVDKYASLQVALSPDGKWLAYTSDATGRFEVYVAPFPGMSSTRLVSTGGGTEPHWSRNGKELFYKGAGRMMVVEVKPGTAFTPGTPRPLFSLSGYRGARNRPQYDVAPDGRFLMVRDYNDDTGEELVYVENWFEELKAKAGKK